MEGRTGPEVEQAARRAAEKLGWEIDPNAHGRLRLADVPSEAATKQPLDVFAEDGRLVVEGDRPSSQLMAPLGPASTVLATVTVRELGLEQSSAPRVTSRSRLAAVALDLLFPAAGALYAGLGDPYLTSGAASWASNPWAQFGLRLALDAGSAAGLAVMAATRRDNWGLWLVYGEMLVVNRVLALVFDMRSIGFRNGYAEGGLAMPEQPLPLPSVASR